ncbi:hypothetical protein OOT55_14275 [Marinimicrobium sp. C6131]|uniref:hypothetical protein n=1 Tax=Marinimicrobium sp. C6131 TaxID=3022676 RepID=UPI00223D64E7|nr:hypothetical protein [Marinimicrobium sp. C6131]UZJ43814.1 hypothetical protein OOT55_14275 [Marinimicrobium sp. C6131]
MTKQRKPYRSKKREEPRVLHATGFLGDSGEPPSESLTGSLTYRTAGPSLMEIFGGSTRLNEERISKTFHKEIVRIESSINFQYELASHYMWLINAPIGVRINEVNDILTPCFHKSMIGLTTAFYLNRQGLWGAARPLIRHAFESLIVAKYCSVNNDSEIFDKWVDGLGIYFTNGILKKIEHPSTEEFSRFWGLMSEYSHSTVYALQPDFNFDDYRDDIDLNFVFIEIMLECKYHLLISHIITSDMKYYQDRYKDKERASELRRLLTANYSEAKKGMAKGSRCLIKDYRCSWKINS